MGKNEYDVLRDISKHVVVVFLLSAFVNYSIVLARYPSIDAIVSLIQVHGWVITPLPLAVSALFSFPMGLVSYFIFLVVSEE